MIHRLLKPCEKTSHPVMYRKFMLKDMNPATNIKINSFINK